MQFTSMELVYNRTFYNGVQHRLLTHFEVRKGKKKGGILSTEQQFSLICRKEKTKSFSQNNICVKLLKCGVLITASNTGDFL